MKVTTPLLLASLAANIVLVAVVANRHSTADSTPAPSGSRTTPAPAGLNSDVSRAALASGDLAALVAAGFPAETAREILLGRAFARAAEKLRAAQGSAGDDRWWRNRSGTGFRDAEASARRELSAALLAAFGDDFGLSGADGAQLSFLSPEKRAALKRITQDYDEMIARYSANGLQLASDREKLQLLRAERQRDIAGLLSPAELAEYEMRTSSSAAMLRARYGDAIATEEDFRKLYALQKAFDDKYPMPNGRVTPDFMRERAAAQRQLQADMRTALGPDGYAALARAADPDLRTIDSLASRLNLPASTSDQIATARDSFAAESQRIAADASLTPPQRQAQLRDLAARAKAALANTLGSEAADAYAQRSPWLNMLQGGMAFSTTPPNDGMIGAMGGPGVYPVMPQGGPAGGVAGAAVTRQVINFSSPDAGPVAAAGPGGDALFFSIATPAAEPAKAISFDTAVDARQGTTVISAPTGGVVVFPRTDAPQPPPQSPPPPAPKQ